MLNGTQRLGVLKRAFAATAAVGLVFAPLVLAPLVVSTGPVAAASGKGPDSVADLAEGLLDAVVNISTSQTASAERATPPVPTPKAPEGSPFQEFFDEFFNKQQKNREREPRKVQSLGSGFVIDAEGIIVTNNHVIDGADEITANFPDGTKLKAELIGKDQKTDIAVLRVKPTKPLKAVKFGNSDKARVGDWVMAIGNPFGLGGTVTVGIVSARNRDINSGPYDNFIQTDAAINRGNSGGPLFNMDGEVIGINTAIISPSGGSIGIGFSIPSNGAAAVVEQLRTYRETRRGWLGVRIQGVTEDIAESLGLKDVKGALVAGVTEKGPAEAAGIQAGDVILKFDGRTVPGVRELPRMVADSAISKEVDVVVLRKGKEETLKVRLGRLEEGEKIEREKAAAGKGTTAPTVQPVISRALGLGLADLDAANRDRFKLNKDKVTKGVVVTEVTPDSPAAEKRIVAGDVILEVGQEEVKSADDVVKRIETLKKDGRKRALFLLSNPDGEMRFVTVQVD
ncbi:DegQ family serine endoprotease [Prosthecodimorpha staleyi]|uniref:Probable periplasmic serine endoprotease DegP-like n=1 Tax=Prosthecodimorpha staleyi TaxID=2840188 RepID=A0A947GCH6_9HYPH|nr:DegQ family serine endoprotease [Prosthecodimorpha staleyi]MBT9291423.1 DegQ family serine endoprotease [Prosthecodimorpha staleyi]